ncbi:hypothetical protein ACFXPQ_25605 [Streptomyces lydicus]
MSSACSRPASRRSDARPRPADGRTVEANEMILDSSAYVLEYDFDA